MKTPVRYSAMAKGSTAGQLMAAGRAELPETAALDRIAHRLGVSALTLGVASATGLASASSGTAAATAAAAPTAVASLLTMTFVKALVIGVGIGAGTLGTVELVRSETRASSALNAHAPVSHQPAPTTRVASDTRAVGDTTTAEPSVPSETTAPSHLGAPAPTNPELQLPAPNQLAHSTPSRASVGPLPAGLPTISRTRATPPAEVAPILDSGAQLAGEVQILDRARSTVARGAAASALLELDDYERNHSFRVLRREVMLVRIEALLSVGRRSEAAAIARQLLQAGAPATKRARLEALANSP